MKVVGVDIGSQKTMMVADDADIILTDTGSISRPSLVAFQGRSRLVGEEAAPQISGDSTVLILNALLDPTQQTADKLKSHLRAQITQSSSGFNVAVNYCDNQETFSLTAILAMFIEKLYARATVVYGNDIKLSFSLPPNYNNTLARTYIEACKIASVDESILSFVDASDCIVATYGRKLQALRNNDKTSLENKNALLIEIGHTKATIVVVHITLQDDKLVATKLASANDDQLGCLHFDFAMFNHFSETCKTTHKTEVLSGTKKGQRLLFACERARKLLSQLPDAKITVENLIDSGDVNFNINRSTFNSICEDLLTRFQALIKSALKSAFPSLSPEILASTISAVEIVGGGVRMPSIQSIITTMFGDNIPLGAKLDDASVALGAALLQVKSESDSSVPIVPANKVLLNDTIGLTATEIQSAKDRELAMQKIDEELKQQLAARNTMESFILEMRSAKRRKHGEKIDSNKLDKLLDDYENWMWDHQDASCATIKDKEVSLRREVQQLCKAFFDATEADRLAVEKSLEAESKKREAEKLAGGEEEEDNDNRKLRKPERMRMVVKNKDEGTELFKGGNFRPAAARYHKALTHCAKFFDLSAEDEAEVKTVKANLYLNLASCYLKLENYDQVIRNCEDAMALETGTTTTSTSSNTIKAYFRRGLAYEAKKELDKAIADIRKCQELNDVEDKAVTQASERIKRALQKEKDKEKKVWGKAFK